MNSNPIGVFDSGVGGLSVLRHIRDELPAEHLLYVADSAYAPYGVKTPLEIQARTLQLAGFLVDRGAKALVIACNTATAAAAEMLRSKFSLPIIAMEPAVKPAVAATRSGVVGVLATSGTLKSAQFAALLENYGQGVRVTTQSGHGLVECVERGALDTAKTRDLLWGYVRPLLEDGADTLVLGCTHYPFLKPLIEEMTEGKVAIIDTGAAVARQVGRRLAESGLQRIKQDEPGGVVFWSSGEIGQAREIMSLLWGAPTAVEALPPAYQANTMEPTAPS
jgi:glutamate racemase